MSQLALFASDAAPARVPTPARHGWRCLYCHRDYVAAIDYQPDACPACGANLEETP